MILRAATANSEDLRLLVHFALVQKNRSYRLLLIVELLNVSNVQGISQILQFTLYLPGFILGSLETHWQQIMRFRHLALRDPEC